MKTETNQSASTFGSDSFIWENFFNSINNTAQLQKCFGSSVHSVHQHNQHNPRSTLPGTTL